MSNASAQGSMVWWTAGGSGLRRGLFEQSAPLQSSPSLRLPMLGAIQASVVFDDHGQAFVADLSGGVKAFSPQGETLWTTQVKGGISATPVVHPDKPQLFLGTHLGWVVALDLRQGTVLWSKEIPTASDPRILSDLLYVPQANTVVFSSWGGLFLALDSNSGAVKFSWDAGNSPSAPAAADRNGRIYCLRAVSKRGLELVRVTPAGEESILHQIPEDKRGARRALVAAGPLIDEAREVLYFVSNMEQAGSLLAWSLKSNRLLWQHSLTSSVQAPLTLRHDGVVLLADLAGQVVAIRADGSLLFRYATECEYLLAGGVCEGDGTYFLGDPYGCLHAINRHGQGKTLFEAKRSIQARPSYDNAGSLYLPSTDHTVYKFMKQAPS